MQIRATIASRQVRGAQGGIMATLDWTVISSCRSTPYWSIALAEAGLPTGGAPKSAPKGKAIQTGGTYCKVMPRHVAPLYWSIVVCDTGDA